MSYQITVEHRAGQFDVHHSGDVPEGRFVVSGHEDDSNRSVAVVVYDAEGRQLHQAGSQHSKG